MKSVRVYSVAYRHAVPTPKNDDDDDIKITVIHILYIIYITHKIYK